jgi:hypothetical protein
MSAEREGPVMNCVYDVIFWPVPLRARSFTIAIASSIVGTIFSIPTTAMCTDGRVVARSALPSFVTSISVPVSAMSALPPVMPTSASMNVCRSSLRATATSDAMSSATGCPTTLLKSCATSSRVLWIAGAMRCDGRSPASWMIHSPRSVSTAWMPCASRWSVSPISSVAIDLDFTTSFAFLARQIAVTMRRASSASTAR